MKKLLYILFILPVLLFGQNFNNVTEVHKGGTEILSIQKGSTLVWEGGYTPDLTDLIAYYTFNNNYNDVHTATYNATGASEGSGSNPSFGTGVEGQSLATVEGANAEYLTIADNDVFTFSDGAGNDEACTVCLWAKSSSADNRAMFFNKRELNTRSEYQLFLDTDGTVQFTVTDPGNNSIYVTARFSLTLSSTWQQICYTYDGSETPNGIQGYLDGVAQTMSTVVTNGAYTGTGNTTSDVYIGVFGQIPTSTSLGLDGEMDNLAVFNRELSATEILENYNLEDAGGLITD